MTGSGAAAGAAGGVAAANGGNAGGEALNGQQPADAGFDPGTLAAQVAELTPGQEEMRQYLADGQSEAGDDAEADPEAEAAGDGLDLSFLDDPGGYDDGFDQRQSEAEAELARIYAAADEQARELGMDGIARDMADAFARNLEAATAPLHEQLDQMRAEQQWRDLAERYPDLADRETAAETFALASDLVTAQGWPGHLPSEPRFIGLVYAAMQSHRAAEAEGDPVDDAAILEGGGGAANAQRQSPGEAFERFLQQGGGGTGLPF